MHSFSHQNFVKDNTILINRNNTNIKVSVSQKTKDDLVYVNEFKSPLPKHYVSIRKKRVLQQNKFKNYDCFRVKPSERYKVRMADLFLSEKHHKSKFSTIYASKGIPCHIFHGGAKMHLIWDIPIEKVDYSSVLPLCFEGLIETDHPYSFASRQSCQDLLSAPGSKEKVLQILPKLFVPLRKALNSDSDEVYFSACEITKIVSLNYNFLAY